MTQTWTEKTPAEAPVKVTAEDSSWTEAELRQVRADLTAEVDRLSEEIAVIEAEISGVVEDPIGADGRDEADVGGKLAEREHEVNLLEGARAGLAQNMAALERLDAGTYGTCESCGEPIGKLRLQAFQRATLCVSCKRAQEKR
ncbi:TraR/DksA family transcriptional regulator [Janibacter cremeus]|uniref:TraR/DksA family transcriptional regulator n=1 Tax=Janibacter cremeus TaxID=1285192 RepID=UPI0023F8DCC8|nr:TraR/DksA family transcriptional regulator [Janibacter cremeus]WEV78863.1 TraR/DksA family transcriptional regulator [Janibacter cremeus]